MGNNTSALVETYFNLSVLIPVFIGLILIVLVVIMFTLMVAVSRLTNIRTELAYLAEEKITQGVAASEKAENERSPLDRNLYRSIWISTAVGLFGVLVLIIGTMVAVDDIGLLMAFVVGGILVLGGIVMAIYSYGAYKKKLKDNGQDR